MRLLDGNLIVMDSQVRGGTFRRKGDTMAPNPRPIEKAPLAGRRLLGVLLAQRRAELGYTHRPAFTRDRLPLTPSGNPNTRLVADIEEAYRANFPDPRLRQIARAYLVNYRSLLDVAHLRRNTLIPVSPGDAPAEVPGEPPGWAPPPGAGRSPAAGHLRDRIWERLRQLALRGVADPDGTAVFLRAGGDPRGYDGIGSAADARDWDGAGSRLDLPDRVALLADLQLADAARAAASRDRAAGS